MLSIEKLPQDPGLKTSSDDDDDNERRDSHKLDLLTLDLVVHNNDNNQLPKFSIRDYVLCARGKDITTNWPFSQRSLELCLKHGLKELLPSFHSADVVRNPSLAKFNGQMDLIDNKNACSTSGKGSSLSDNLNSVCNTSGGGGPGRFLSCLEIEASALPGPSIDKPKVVLQRAFKKRESINQSSKKKCTKSSNMSHHSTKQDIAVNANASMVSEAIAVCPVCRVFSSSSNTTLNAHMDQCLSGETTTKLLGDSDSKLIKHRIKPKRMRLMVDIYKTAAQFTIEDLDRRNGTNWASNLCFPAEGVEMLADRNTQQLNFQETTSEGPVYIDANGTKLRILSKSSDFSMGSKGLDGPQPRKHTKGDSESKLLLAKKMKKKKKNPIQKQHNVLKHLPPGKMKSSEINKHGDRNMSHEETNAKEECKMKQLKDHDQLKFSKTETIRGWVCSKRTGLTKKTNDMVDHPRSGEFMYGDLRAKHNSSASGNCEINQQSLSRSANGYPSNQRVGIPPHERCDESGDQPSLRKIMKFSTVESPVPRDRTRSLAFEALAERDIVQSSSDDTTPKDHTSSPSKRRVAIESGAYRSATHPAINGKLSTRHHSLPSKSRKLSSVRKKLQPTTAAHGPNSNFYLNKKSSVTKKPREFHISESNKGVTGSQSQFLDVMGNPVKELIRTETSSSEESMDANVVRSFKRSRGRISRNKEEAFMKTSTRSTPISYLSDTEEIDGSSMLNDNLRSDSDTSLSAEYGIDGSWREVDVDLSSDSEGLPVVGSSNSLNPGLKDSLYEAEAPMLSSEAAIFCANVTPESMVAVNMRMMVEMDSGEGKATYMDEVDAIPIPGPPGSFLPSPGRMDSDDLQGNSSLTSTRFQCSAECQELVDHSSEPPAAISTTSTINLSEKSSAVVAYSDFVTESCLAVEKANSGGGTDMLRSDIGNVSEFRSINCQDSQLLRRRTVGSTFFCSEQIQMNDQVMNRRLDYMKLSSSERRLVHVDNNDTTPAGYMSHGGFVDTQVKLRDVGGDVGGEVGPSTPVLRLMGKNLMVINKDENTVSRLTSESSQNAALHKVPHLVSQGSTCENLAMPQTAYMNPTMFSTRSIHADLTEFLIHPGYPGDGKVDSTTISSNNNCINAGKGGQSLVGIPVSISMSDETQNFSPYYLTERYKDARYNGFLFDGKSSIPSRTKWSQC